MNKLDIINDYKLQNFDYSSFINVQLTSKDKKTFCELLNLRDHRGNTLMWRRIRKLLEDYYFKIENKVVRINGKHTRVSIIIDELENLGQ